MNLKISLLEDEPYVLSALGVRISQSPFEKSVDELYEECRANREKSRELVRGIMEKHRHMILGDFLPYAVVFEGLTRLAALYIWRNVNALNLIFGGGIEASLRVVEPSPNMCIPLVDASDAIETYYEILGDGVPRQDARYVLPEGIQTRMILSCPPRYFGKLAGALKDSPLPEFAEIGGGLEKIVEDKFGMRVEESAPSKWEFFGQWYEVKERIEISWFDTNPHSLSLFMRVKGSLAMYGQLVRQRQVLCEIEPMESIARKGKFVVPVSFSEEARKKYQEIAEDARRKQMKLIEQRDPSFAYFLLLGQETSSILHSKGYGIIETSRARSEGVAQWEIRTKVGVPITKELAKFEALRHLIGPRCWREKRCIEPGTFKKKFQRCPSFEKSLGKWEGSLEELLDLLTEKYMVFLVGGHDW